MTRKQKSSSLKKNKNKIPLIRFINKNAEGKVEISKKKRLKFKGICILVFLCKVELKFYKYSINTLVKKETFN